MSEFELMPLKNRRTNHRRICNEVAVRYDINWRGWDEYFSYWDKFVKNWHESEARPTDEYSTTLSRLFANRNEDARLTMRELPEPYYGNPHKAKGIVVNLNPGESDRSESSKFYPSGELINAFANECQRKYSEYSKRYSSLLRMDVCGSDWWHKENRVGWMKRFFGVGPEDIFALEACPYHSKEWKSSFYDFSPHVIDRVIAPALVAASGNKKFPCAAFIGSEFSRLIAKVRGMTKIGGWRGKRSYELYSYEFTLEQNIRRTVYAVAIDGVQGMWLPSDDAKNIQVEDRITKIVQSGPLQHQ